jgi:uncharacterized delta-60 repeat protein
MIKPQKSAVISKITKGIVPTTAIASGFLSPPSWGAPGDLDPTFGDMGRTDFPLNGAAFHVQGLSSGESLIAGGEHFVHRGAPCDYNHYFCAADEGFMGQVSPTGSLDLQLATALLAGTEVLDFTIQPDGKVVAVGEMISAYHSVLTVFRLIPGGLLDPHFAASGVLHYGINAVAHSVVLDPSGAIVVAASNAGNLMVLRLLSSGALDGSFAHGGVYDGPAIDGARIHILRTASGGYRVSATLSNRPQVGASSCGVIALTAAGVVDTTFGQAGIASVLPHKAGTSTGCQAMTAQSDGSLVLGGQEGGHGFVNRLLAGGALDASFAADAVQSNMSEATALAIDPAGSILVGGAPNPGVPGALILRLHATGLLDGLFGSAGLTWIDLPASKATGPNLEDLSVLADGRILAAGGDSPTSGGRGQPLLVRLLGTDVATGPGIIGVTQSLFSVREKDNTVAVTVRRMGGAAGEVSVAYQTADYTVGDAAAAISGTDYTPVTGRLTWADGDRTDRQITVPILNDAGPVVEEAERFNVLLTDAKGGAEIGTQETIVEIAGDGDPAGQFGFADSALSVSEADGSVQVAVNRNYYSKGAVSVTVTPTAGSATTAEFTAAPITLSWADGDADSKTATIPIVNEKVAKSSETFTVDLSNATNGALIGPHSHLVVTINYDYQPPPPPPPPVSPVAPSGGGGMFDWLTLLCLSCVHWLRRHAF